jgi:phosphoglycolate phosphatase-like HAD superfamily hydrolase
MRKALPMSMPTGGPSPSDQRPVVVLDIDGVLADVRHRLHFLTSRPKAWDAFFAAAGHDPVLHPGADLAHQAAIKCRIVYLTGRPERIRRTTSDWLARHGLPAGALLMRPNNDRRPARVVKLERLRDLATHDTVVLVVDDDRDVVATLRAAGFTVRLADWMPPAGTVDAQGDLFDVAVLDEAQQDLGRT